MAHRQPGKSYRQGIALAHLFDTFPNEKAAQEWFESVVWAKGRYCPRCGSTSTHEAKHAKCPYRCRDCGKYFSVKTGTAMASSKVSLRKWAIAIYIDATSPKGVSSLQLHRDIGVSQPTAWFMLHRIREGFTDKRASMDGLAEIDEMHIGGKRKNMPKSKRKERSGRSATGRTAVVGVKDRQTRKARAKVVADPGLDTLHEFHS